MEKMTPIYTTRGDWAAMLVGPFLYNPQGEWIGWVDQARLVWSVRGDYVGWLSKDFRVLRKRDITELYPRRTPPPRQPRLKMPARVPFAPLMADLTFDTIDVFEDDPDRLDPGDMDKVADID